MAVGGIRGGGGKGGPKGAKGAGGSAPTSKAGQAFVGRTEKTESLVGPSREVASSGAGAARPADPVSAQALEIARQLKNGELKTKDEATKKLVAQILKDKLKMQSKALTRSIAETIQDDPRLNQALERMWTKE